MTAATSIVAAIDMRVQPSWRWAEEDAPPSRTATLKGYDRVYGEEFRSLNTHASLVADLRRLNIRAVVQSEPVGGGAAASNDRVAAVIARAPDCFLAGFGSADPRDGLAAMREIDRFHRELGLRGLAMMADFFNMDISDKRCWPLYAKAAELGIPVGVHVGINFSTNSPIRHGHPSFIDEIACHYPELVIICNHGGWPWAAEMVAIAWKHTNVYLEFGAIAPRYLASSEGGWQPMRQFMNSLLQDRILFGSDWPMLSHDRLMTEIPLLQLKDSVLEKYLKKNAEKLLDRILG
jgi:predicted TIM-barrel fold metal-dependent hydrolase